MENDDELRQVAFPMGKVLELPKFHFETWVMLKDITACHWIDILSYNKAMDASYEL